MSQETKTIFVTRVKSFLWRLAGMIGVAVLGFIGDNLGLFNLNPQVAVVLGLVVGEVTKWLNTKSS